MNIYPTRLARSVRGALSAHLPVFFLILHCLSFGSVGSAQTPCVPGVTTPGSLDTCFGFGGTMTTTVNFGTGASWANAVAVQADGKIVVAAHSTNYPSGTGNDFYVLRYDTHGFLDPSFGTGGVARISFTSSDDSETPYSVAIQSDGKIVVAGAAPVKARSSTVGFAVARLNSDGSIDTSFGQSGSGKIVFSFTNGQDAIANGIALQSNGYIVVAGRSNNNFAVARLTGQGSLDLGFNGTGKVLVQTAKSSETMNVFGAYDVTIQRVLVSGALQEKVVAVGIRPPVSGVGRDFATIRLNPNGALDSTFGSGGKVFTDWAGLTDQASGVAVDASNRIVVVGHTFTDANNMKFALVRYTENGQLDSSFGSGGKVVANAWYVNRFEGVVIQSDGMIAASGWVRNEDSTAADFAVARFDGSGNPDSSFGSDGTGIVTTNIVDGKWDHGLGGLALQPDGKIVVVGGAGSANWTIALARYLP